jgi:glycosyltransferase involved in cell wall biosynthesis
MAEYLVTLCNSILNIKQQIQFIFVFYSSSDESLDIVKGRFYNYKNVILLEVSSDDLAYARNIGILHAKSKYISFFDADDWIDAENLLNVSRFLNFHDFDLVVNEYFSFKSEKSILYEIKSIPKNIKVNKYLEKYFVDGYHKFEVWNKIYKLDIIKKNNILFDSKEGIYGEDILFNLNYFQFIKSIRIINYPFYYHLIRTSSITNKSRPNLTNRFLHLIDKVHNLDFIEKVKFKLYSKFIIELIIEYSKKEKDFNLFKNNMVKINEFIAHRKISFLIFYFSKFKRKIIYSLLFLKLYKILFKILIKI